MQVSTLRVYRVIIIYHATMLPSIFSSLHFSSFFFSARNSPTPIPISLSLFSFLFFYFLSSSLSLCLSLHITSFPNPCASLIFSLSLSLSLFSFFSSFLYLPHRHEFCWICMQDWTLHSNVTGGYFQCNRFDANAARAEGDGGSQADADSQTQG